MLMAMEVRYSPDNREVIIGDTLIGTLRKEAGADLSECLKEAAN